MECEAARCRRAAIAASTVKRPRGSPHSGDGFGSIIRRWLLHEPPLGERDRLMTVGLMTRKVGCQTTYQACYVKTEQPPKLV